MAAESISAGIHARASPRFPARRVFKNDTRACAASAAYSATSASCYAIRSWAQ